MRGWGKVGGAGILIKAHQDQPPAQQYNIMASLSAEELAPLQLLLKV